MRKEDNMIDLHMHTHYSDGTDNLSELLQNAENKKLEIISITDHDQIGSYQELENHPSLRKLFSGMIIPGSELKAVYRGIAIEVLAYGIDYKKLRIHQIDQDEVQNEALKELTRRMEQLGFRYNLENLYIDRTDPAKQWASYVVASEMLRHPENEELVKKYGNFTATSFFRMHASNPKSVFYYDESVHFLSLPETIERIHEAGGLAFLAHPFLYPFDDKVEMIEEILKTTKIDGIEAEYPLFSSEERETIKKYAHQYHKYISGGSDYHAKTKPDIEMGTGKNHNLNISKDLVKDWIEQVRTI